MVSPYKNGNFAWPQVAGIEVALHESGKKFDETTQINMFEFFCK